MNKTWLIIEKIIGSLLTIWGIIALYGITSTVVSVINNGFAATVNITYFQLFLGNHLNFFLGLAAVFGGYMLISNDKPGWILAIISLALYVVAFFRSSQANSIDNSQPYYVFFKSYSLMALLFLVMLILLIQKPFLKKYHVSLKNWLWIGIIITVCILDKIFIK